jgi:hypothetical protein
VLPSAAAPSHWRATSASPRALSIAQIAASLGRSPATVEAYFYDPTGQNARAVKKRYLGVPGMRCLHAVAQRQARRMRVRRRFAPGWEGEGARS